MCVSFKSFFLFFGLRLAKEIGFNCSHEGAWAADKMFGAGGNGGGDDYWGVDEWKITEVMSLSGFFPTFYI